MNIGISISSSHKVSDTRLGASRMISRVKAASAAKLDSLFLGDHHAVSSPYYQNIPMLGRLLADWTDKPAGSLHLLPLWHPVLLAEQIATLANIHSGQFILQCGQGYGEHQFAAMGANLKHRPTAFEQSITVLRQLWQGETVSLEGRWRFKNARISPLPPEKVALWIAAAAPIAIDRAARIGDAWLAEPNGNLDDAENSMAIYQQGLQKYARPQPKTIAIRKDVFVAANEAQAAEVISASQSYRDFKPGSLLIGTDEQVAEQISAYQNLGYTDLIVRNLHPDQEMALSSISRLEQVKELLLG